MTSPVGADVFGSPNFIAGWADRRPVADTRARSPQPAARSPQPAGEENGVRDTGPATPEAQHFPAATAPRIHHLSRLDAAVAPTVPARLVAWREEVALVKRRSYREWECWARPVPGLGPPDAALQRGWQGFSSVLPCSAYRLLLLALRARSARSVPAGSVHSPTSGCARSGCSSGLLPPLSTPRSSFIPPACRASTTPACRRCGREAPRSVTSEWSALVHARGWNDSLVCNRVRDLWKWGPSRAPTPSEPQGQPIAFSRWPHLAAHDGSVAMNPAAHQHLPIVPHTPHTAQDHREI
ncbi:hypothetical protein Spla01_02430 [Streptomyces platensis]|uniref:Uncharacterized protein n=1 Tax=Streptomyces platensis TaxID=58346 RepID=A0ABX3XSD0_STRPT|nr:hypothetical protein BG653_05041 [Streptomyces platensis]